ncbi:chorismate lyase [Castellaniella sp.]|uniref:chorismate--pyruvate lyase family protein n=1 Tax=Castellaniella sp. TaxID=1955812 RepID=UPI00355FFE7B
MKPVVACPRAWHAAPRPGLGPLQRAWLQQPGALTAGLRRLGHLTLRVQREAMLALPACWAHEAGVPVGTAVWWREILMSIGGRPAVQACSFTPRLASQGAWKAMRGLGSHPLADILYGDARITRSRFRFGQLQARQAGDPWIATRAQDVVQARHSIFLRQGQPLLVAEYFLPGFWPLASESAATGLRGRFPPYGCG